LSRTAIGAKPAMRLPMPLLLVLSIAAFVSAFTIRMIDPLVPAIGRDLGIPVETAALLASAYTFPYALSQPILGALGDGLGKARVIKVCLGVMAVSLGFGAIAASFEYLFLSRILAGIAGGGVIPVSFAVIGDRFPIADRQWALSRLVMSSQIAILLGTAFGGLVATHLGWRWMFAVPAGLTALVFLMTLKALPTRRDVVRPRFTLAAARAGYVEVFRSPWAAVVLCGVFTEGVAMSGLTPFVAARIEQRGLGTLAEAGLVLAAMAVGGISFTVLVRQLLARLGRALLVRAGGVLTLLGLSAAAYSPTWQVEAACFFVIGFGFFMVHNSLQASATELAPNARGSGIASFAFLFFLGQAIGPIFYSLMFRAFGPHVPLVVGGSAILAVAVWFGARLERADAVHAV
jgi:predicted MFS family arabinose efflux permease